jgi:adenylate cyclase class 2
VKKQRTKYSWEGVIIALDKVEGLGRFIEVEAEDSGEYKEQKRKVMSAMSKLGLQESIRSSYLELLEEMRKNTEKEGAMRSS